MARFFVCLLGFAFLSVGIGIGWFLGKPILDEAKASEDWPTVTGVVIESDVEARQDRDRNGNGNRSSTTYKAIVVYDYTVDGKEYSSGRIWFGSDISTSDQAQMRNIVKGYPTGSDVKVYYNPDDPAEAVLQPGVFFTSYFLLIFGGVFAVVGSVVMIVGFITLRPKPSLEEVARKQQIADSFHDDDDFSHSGMHNHQHDNEGFGPNHWNDSIDDD